MNQLKRRLHSKLSEGAIWIDRMSLGPDRECDTSSRSLKGFAMTMQIHKLRKPASLCKILPGAYICATTAKLEN